MLALIQRVTQANVKVENHAIAVIEKGILALIGFEKTDTKREVESLLDKILNYRIFQDEQDKMNLSLKDINGGLLLVPQFTLVAETNKGMRPGFSKGMPPQEGKALFEFMVDHAKSTYPIIVSGEFGANMQVNLCNDGPVTFLLEAKNKT